MEKGNIKHIEVASSAKPLPGEEQTDYEIIEFIDQPEKVITYHEVSVLTPNEYRLRDKKAEIELKNLLEREVEIKKIEEDRAEIEKKSAGDKYIPGFGADLDRFSAGIALTIDLEKGRVEDVKVEGDRIIVINEGQAVPRLLLTYHEPIIETQKVVHGPFISVILSDISGTEVDTEGFLKGAGFGYMFGSIGAGGSGLSIGVGIFGEKDVLTLRPGFSDGDAVDPGTKPDDVTRTNSFFGILLQATITFF